MINWNSFKALIGNGRRKYIKRGKEKYHFISYNPELERISIMNTKTTRIIHVVVLKCFIEDFEFVGMTDEKPLF